MRSKKFLSGPVIMIMAALLFLAVGCSDETAPTSNVTTGSTDDPQYVMVEGQINNYLDSAVVNFSTGFDNLSRLPSDTGKARNDYGPMNPEDTVVYVYFNGWHILYISRSNIAFVDRFMDSVQFMDNGVPVLNPVDIDYMHFIRHREFAHVGNNASHVDVSGNIDLEFNGLDGTVATITGDKNLMVNWVYASGDTTIEAMYDMDVVVDDVTINKAGETWSDGCPSGGGVNIDINQSYTVDVGFGPNLYVRAWQVQVTFQSGVADVMVRSGLKVWRYSRTLCTPPSE